MELCVKVDLMLNTNQLPGEEAQIKQTNQTTTKKSTIKSTRIEKGE